jgi:hypothetical protein
VNRGGFADALVCCVAVSISGLLVHGRSLDGFFLADDYTIIGSFWGKGAPYLAGLLVSDEIGGVWEERFVRPVRPLSLALEAGFSGLDPFRFHLTNLLLHTGSSALVGILVLQLGGPFLGAALASLLFLIHPLNVEAAVWISARDESLSGGFLLGAVACHLEAAKGRRRVWRVLAWALFTMSLFAKEYAMLLPVALWAWAWISPLEGRPRLRAVRESVRSSVPILAIIALFLALRSRVSGHPLGGYGDGSEAHVTLRPDFFVESVAGFARDLLVPLAGHPYLAGALLVGLFPLVAKALRRDTARGPVLFWGLFWPTLFLMPTHNLVYTPRHLYASFAGIAVASGLLLIQAGDKWLLRLALPAGGALMVLLAPPTLASVDDFTRASTRCRTALSAVDLATRSFPHDDVLVLVGMPAHETPPWGFGWSLEDALRPPFVAESVDSRLEVVNRRQWRPEAWAAYRDKFPGRGIHVLAWNPVFLGIQMLREGRDPLP